MAHDAGPSGAGLRGQDPAAPEAVAFFQLLRRLEGEGRRWGRAGGPSREPARLGQGVRLATATRDVARVVPRGEGRPPLVEVEVIGLLGPEGPLPLHLTRWIFERTSRRWFDAAGDRVAADTAFLDLCNLVQHRLIALYWRAWADARAAVQAERPGGGRLGAAVVALAGLGLPGLRPGSSEARATEPVKLAHATRIAGLGPGAERIAAPFADFLGTPVRLVEFVGGWTEIPPRLQTRPGRAHARLGRDAVVGARAFSRQDRAELRVGPMGLDAYRRLAGDRAEQARVRHLLVHLAGREVEVGLRPVLRGAEVPDPRLGRVALGRDAWLPARAPRDRDDFRLARLNLGPPAEAAA